MIVLNWFASLFFFLFVQYYFHGYYSFVNLFLLPCSCFAGDLVRYKTGKKQSTSREGDKTGFAGSKVKID